jgi:hypothetical protein
LQGSFVVFGIAKDEHPSRVLGRGAKQGRTANINLFDQAVVINPAGRRLRKGVEVDDDDIDGLEPMGLELGLIVPATSQDPAVNARVKRLDATTKELGSAGEL